MTQKALRSADNQKIERDMYYIPGISTDSQHDPRSQLGKEYRGPGDTDTAKQACTAKLRTAINQKMKADMGFGGKDHMLCSFAHANEAHGILVLCTKEHRDRASKPHLKGLRRAGTSSKDTKASARNR